MKIILFKKFDFKMISVLWPKILVYIYVSIYIYIYYTCTYEQTNLMGNLNTFSINLTNKFTSLLTNTFTNTFTNICALCQPRYPGSPHWHVSISARLHTGTVRYLRAAGRRHDSFYRVIKVFVKGVRKWK